METKLFKVLEDDHHDQMSVHVFRDKEQFFAYMSDDDEFDAVTFEDDGIYNDGNGNAWSEFDGIYEVDHTKDK